MTSPAPKSLAALLKASSPELFDALGSHRKILKAHSTFVMPKSDDLRAIIASLQKDKMPAKLQNYLFNLSSAAVRGALVAVGDKGGAPKKIASGPNCVIFAADERVAATLQALRSAAPTSGQAGRATKHGGDATEEAAPAFGRRQLADKLAAQVGELAKVFGAKSPGAVNPYAAVVASLMRHLAANRPAAAEVARYLLEAEPLTNFVVLLEPYKLADTPYLLTDRDLAGWDPSLAQEETPAEYFKAIAFNAASGPPAEGANGATNDALDADMNATAVDKIRRIIEGGETNNEVWPAVFKAYVDLHLGGKIDGRLNVLPDAVRTAYDSLASAYEAEDAAGALAAGALAAGKSAAGKSAADALAPWQAHVVRRALWQDNVRFAVATALSDMCSFEAFTPSRWKALIDTLRTELPGNSLSELGILGVNYFGEPHLLPFVRTTAFLHQPAASAPASKELADVTNIAQKGGVWAYDLCATKRLNNMWTPSASYVSTRKSLAELQAKDPEAFKLLVAASKDFSGSLAAAPSQAV